jgi:hypothetical protein
MSHRIDTFTVQGNKVAVNSLSIQFIHMLVEDSTRTRGQQNVVEHAKNKVLHLNKCIHLINGLGQVVWVKNQLDAMDTELDTNIRISSDPKTVFTELWVRNGVILDCLPKLCGSTFDKGTPSVQSNRGSRGNNSRGWLPILKDFRGKFKPAFVCHVGTFREEPFDNLQAPILLGRRKKHTNNGGRGIFHRRSQNTI